MGGKRSEPKMIDRATSDDCQMIQQPFRVLNRSHAKIGPPNHWVHSDN